MSKIHPSNSKGGISINENGKHDKNAKQILRAKSFMEAPINPFIHEVVLTTKDKIRIAIMSVTIAPIRLFLAIICLVIAWLVAFFSTLGLELEVKNPVSAWRRMFIFILRPLVRSMMFFLGVLWVNVKGKPAAYSEAPTLVMAPHSTFYDAVPCAFTAASCVAKIEIAELPLMKTLLKTLQPVLVERNDPLSRQKTIEEIRRRVHSGQNWPHILVFPEGTCTNRKALINFKAGAFVPGLPVQPVLIRYLNSQDTFTWTMNGPSTLQCLWLSLCQFQIKMEVEYMDVYKPNEEEIKDPKLFARNVRKVMADALNVPCTEHTFEDTRLMYHAQKKDLPLETGLVEFSKLTRKLGISIDDMQELLNEYADISRSCKDGMMGIEEFASHLKLPVTTQLEELFNMYDRTGSGFIDFREYVIGMSLVSQAAVTEKTVRLAFKVFDTNNDGHITVDELEHILKAAFGMDVDAQEIYKLIEKDEHDRITYEQFYKFAKRRPEYAKLFVAFTELENDDVKSNKNLENLLKKRKQRKESEKAMESSESDEQTEDKHEKSQ